MEYLLLATDDEQRLPFRLQRQPSHQVQWVIVARERTGYQSKISCNQNIVIISKQNL
ncbi:hypothetical protein [Nostoc sp.]